VATPEARFSLLCRSGSVLCALPLEHVVEVMRPLPIDALPGAPDFVAGMSIVRGAPLPVLVVGRLFGAAEKRPERLVVARVGERRVGLAVDAIVGIRALDVDRLQRLPPLLRDAPGEAVSEIGALDGELLVVLEAARIVPQEVFAAVEMEAAS